MIDYLIKEYIAIADHLLVTDHEIRKENIVALKDEIHTMLKKNNYLPVQEKLKVWKALGWIDAEENRVTKRVHLQKLGRYEPCILIRVRVYETLKKYR